MSSKDFKGFKYYRFGFHIAAFEQEDKTWTGIVTGKNSTARLSSSFAYTSPDWKDQEAALRDCRRYVDTELDPNPPSIYKMTITKMSSKSGDVLVCDIDGPNFVFCDTPTHTGMQCNHVGGTENYLKIQELSRKMADMMIEIHKLNTIEQDVLDRREA